MNTMTIPKFDYDDACRAADEWGCNCGPSALAAVLGKTLEEVRPACERVAFRQRGYMNVTMMLEAIQLCGASIRPNRLPLDKRIACDESYLPLSGLARLQWSGPWIKNGKAQKWAANYTHWIAAWRERLGVFDINSGLVSFSVWVEHVVPEITKSYKRADGEWFVTHSWEINA